MERKRENGPTQKRYEVEMFFSSLKIFILFHERLLELFSSPFFNTSSSSSSSSSSSLSLSLSLSLLAPSLYFGND
jgi:hypothetical protein